MKKLIALILTLVCVIGLAACHDIDESGENNLIQTLSLSFVLNDKVYSYNIEYDSDGMIVKVDNTDYYEFLEDGELITDVRILDTELTDYFLTNGGTVK